MRSRRKSFRLRGEVSQVPGPGEGIFSNQEQGGGAGLCPGQDARHLWGGLQGAPVFSGRAGRADASAAFPAGRGRGYRGRSLGGGRAGRAQLRDLPGICGRNEKVGESLMRGEGSPLKQAEWSRLELVSQPIGKQADLVVASYVVNEIRREDQGKVLCKAVGGNGQAAAQPQWNRARRRVSGSEKEAHEPAAGSGARVLAPCPQEGSLSAAGRGLVVTLSAVSSAHACTSWQRKERLPLRMRNSLLSGGFREEGNLCGSRVPSIPIVGRATSGWSFAQRKG